MYAVLLIDPTSILWSIDPPTDHYGMWSHHSNPKTALPELMEHLFNQYGISKYDVRDNRPTDVRPKEPLLHPDLVWLAVELGIPVASHSSKSLAGAIRSFVSHIEGRNVVT